MRVPDFITFMLDLQPRHVKCAAPSGVPRQVADGHYPLPNVRVFLWHIWHMPTTLLIVYGPPADRRCSSHSPRSIALHRPR
jgi:hypothetical protein